MSINTDERPRKPSVNRTWLLLAAMCVAVFGVTANASAQTFPNFDVWRSGGFRGFGVPTYLNETDWDAFESTGANLARVFVRLPAPARGSNVFQMPSDTYDKIDRMVEQARRRNVKIVVTFSPLPKAPDSTFWFHSVQRDSIVDVIEQFARHYSGDSVFAGFDIINEPYPVAKGHPEAPRDFDGPAAWSALSTRIITAVRRQDPTRIIILEWPYWSGRYENLRPIPFEGVVYSTHWYTPHDLTHAGIKGRPLGVTYPSSARSNIGEWNRSVLQEKLALVRQFQQTYNLPVFIGEFSCTRTAPGQADFRYVRDLASIFEEYNWNWSYHSFRSAPEWDAELATGVRGQARSMNTDTMTYLRQIFARNQ